MTREERENALHCLKVMIDEEVCEECNLYGTTGTDHCEADCVRVAIKALEQHPNRCDSCTHSEEQDGLNCYECVKGMADNFETQSTDILDKIRAEITDWQTDIHDNEYDAEIHDFVFERIYEILDEYKAESEERNG